MLIKNVCIDEKKILCIINVLSEEILCILSIDETRLMPEE